MTVTLYGDNDPPADDRPTVQVTAVQWPVEELEPASLQRDGKRPRRTRILIAAGIATAVLASVAGVGAFAYAGDVPRGTTVLGTELGGRSQADATRELRAALERQAGELNAPLPVRVGERTAELVPAEVGLQVDVDATVTAAMQAQAHVVDRLVGSRTVRPVVTVDEERLDAALKGVLGDQGRKMTMPGITWDGLTPKAIHPQPSLGLDPEASTQAVREGWLSNGPVTIPLAETHAVTTAEEVDRMVAELAKPAVAAPVTLTTDKGSLSIPPKAIAKSLRFTADKAGTLAAEVDVKQLRTALGGDLAKVEVTPKNARMTLSGGKPKIIASSDGKELDTATLGEELLAVLPQPDNRRVTGTLKPTKPELTTEKLAGLGIKEKVSTFTTRFSGGLSSPRSQNIITAAKAVDHTLVLPGETFSLNKHTGERNYAKGYQDAPVILNGKLVPGVGGGVSQFTTTLFNATYYAGLEDVEHKPHSYYFSRYPSVIESTIFYPNLDFKFRNNTKYGVLIDTSYTSSTITVSIWSTKIWDRVKTEYSPRRNITKPKTVYLEPGPTCIAARGSDGFSQDAYRVFHKDGKVVKREKFSWRYAAEPRFICGPEPESS
ncbi:VanW family protein [Salinispora arenicola]|uniref:VanW family protein n=1 Tax=Salinispora arenicola TaxID=168697 RepID=UPI00207999F2|nr:VanW family protein [Salinispora arenicola]MCN0154466.1 VanW family protein [Salinispora arenicola]